MSTFTRSNYINDYRSRGTITFSARVNQDGYLYKLDNTSNVLNEEDLKSFITPGFVLVDSNCSSTLSLGDDTSDNTTNIKNYLKLHPTLNREFVLHFKRSDISFMENDVTIGNNGTTFDFQRFGVGMNSAYSDRITLFQKGSLNDAYLNVHFSSDLNGNSILSYNLLNQQDVNALNGIISIL